MLPVRKRFVKVSVTDLYGCFGFFLVVELIAGIAVIGWQTGDQVYSATAFVILEKLATLCTTAH